MVVTGDEIELENLIFLGSNPTPQNITEDRIVCFSFRQSGSGEKAGKESLKAKTFQDTFC